MEGELVKNKIINIIDVRQVDAYNGWKCENEPRGGYIKGAKSLSIKWTKYMDWIEVVRSKQILSEDEIVTYGYTQEQSEKVAALFVKAGYGNISVYNGFVDEWCADPDLPMEQLKRYKNLVSAKWG
jgi:thiosulfate/3-mercaptopyruvate sulfurtransferase